MGKVFANGPVDRGSIPGRVIQKTQKMVIDATLLNPQHYKVRIKRKEKQSRKWPHLSVVAIRKRAFGSPLTMVANFTLQYSSLLTDEKNTNNNNNNLC